MANWYDEPVTVKKVKQVRKVKETRLISKNFYDVINAIRDEEIQARRDFYVSCMDEYSTPLKDMGFPEKGDYDRHNLFNSLPYVLLPSEVAKHEFRMSELEEEWQEYIGSKERDYDDYEEKLKEATDNKSDYFEWRRTYFENQPLPQWKISHFSFECRFKIHGKNKPITAQYYTHEFHNMIEFADGTIKCRQRLKFKDKKIDWFNHMYTIRDGSGSGRYEIPSYILKTRRSWYGRSFGYSERESIFNEPTVTFNKKGEPMATAKATDVIKSILDKNGATVSKVKKKTTKVSASDKKKKLREKWVKHILTMKNDLETSGATAKGIRYVRNDKKIEDSYWEVEFTLQRQQLGLSKGKGTFELPSKERLLDFLQDMIDAISVETFDAQILSHQRKVEKARKEAKEKKEKS
jgi:hypothetical protein